MQNADVVRVFYEEIWNKLDKSKIPELFHPDFSFRGSLGPVKTGYAEFAEYVDFVTAALGEYRCEIEEIVSEGNKVFAKVLFSGVHQKEFLGYAPTQKRVAWIGTALFTF